MTRLARSIFIVPATDWVLIEAASKGKAALAILDLDDFVASGHKVESRARVILALNQIKGIKAITFNGRILDAARLKMAHHTPHPTRQAGLL